MKAIRREQLLSGLCMVLPVGVIVGFFHECISQGFTQEQLTALGRTGDRPKTCPAKDQEFCASKAAGDARPAQVHRGVVRAESAIAVSVVL